MKIAFIVPALANKGPVLVVKDLVSILVKQPDVQVTVFYFDDIVQVKMDTATTRISFNDRFNFDDFHIIHSHGLRPNKYVTKYRHEIKGTCIATMHSNIYEEYKYNYNRIIAALVVRIWKPFLKSQNIIISLSFQMEQFYRRLLPEKKMEVIYNGRVVGGELAIDSQDISIIEEVRRKYVLLGTACILTYRKGIHQIIKALPLLPGCALLIIGDGPEKDKLLKLAEKQGVAHRCLFIGSRAAASRYFPLFDVFIMSSYSEGVPLALLEAAGSKVAAICSDIPLFRELFDSTEVSFFELDNSRSLADAVIKTQANRSMFSVNLYRKYCRKFTAEEMGMKHLRLYRDNCILTESK